ncbi:hypothetical protein LCGC14_0472040 [marine sediment metagenome]|uniref:Uncharacterized protein n=1 Tax=marine sediment metagenome TaxID=412755 RepID=A0A0F9VKS5_9ZZZZ
MIRVDVSRGANLRQVLVHETEPGEIVDSMACPFCEHGEMPPVTEARCVRCSAQVGKVVVVGEDMTASAPRGYHKPIRKFGAVVKAGESKIQGRGDVDPAFHSLMEAMIKAVEAKHLPPTVVDGFVRALAQSKQKGLFAAQNAVEDYETRLKNGELGNIPATKVVTELRRLLNNMALGAVGHSFF